jgi:hypothetical protein
MHAVHAELCGGGGVCVCVGGGGGMVAGGGGEGSAGDDELLWTCQGSGRVRHMLPVSVMWCACCVLCMLCYVCRQMDCMRTHACLLVCVKGGRGRGGVGVGGGDSLAMINSFGPVKDQGDCATCVPWM